MSYEKNNLIWNEPTEKLKCPVEFLYIPPHPQKSPEYPEDIFYVKSVLDAFVLILTGDDEMKAQSHTICERKSGSSTSHPSQFTTAIDRGKHPVE